jgi:transposase InsO family protein
MGRRGNPYDNAKAESFMKTLKVEADHLREYDTFEDVTADLPRLSTRSTIPDGSTLRSDISARPNPRNITPSSRSKPAA